MNSVQFNTVNFLLSMESALSKKVDKNTDRFKTLLNEMLEYIELDFPKYVQMVIDREFYNKGTLQVGWLIERDDEGWVVEMVNNSRCTIRGLADTSKVKDISPQSEVKILFKPESVNLEENEERKE